MQEIIECYSKQYQYHCIFKNKLFVIILATFLFCSVNLNSNGFCAPLSEIGETWAKIITPFNSYFGNANPYHLNRHDGLYINNKNYYVTTPGIYGGYVEGSIIQKLPKYFNSITKLLIFGNRKMLNRLILAANLGDFQIPYTLFVHDKNGSIYLAKELNASAVLLYGYSWIINIPAKFLNTWDFFIENYGYASFGAKIKMTLDILWSFIMTILVELPLALINTVIGFITALIFHPIDSILAIPGCIYYAIISTFNAIWGIVANFLMIPYHLLA